MKEDIDVGMRCIKYMLFTTNFMFAVSIFLNFSSFPQKNGTVKVKTYVLPFWIVLFSFLSK